MQSTTARSGTQRYAQDDRYTVKPSILYDSGTACVVLNDGQIFPIFPRQWVELRCPAAMLKVRARIPLHFSALDCALAFDGQPSETVPTLWKVGTERNKIQRNTVQICRAKSNRKSAIYFRGGPSTGGCGSRVTHCNNCLYPMLCHERTADSEIPQIPAQPEVCK